MAISQPRLVYIYVPIPYKRGTAAAHSWQALVGFSEKMRGCRTFLDWLATPSVNALLKHANNSLAHSLSLSGRRPSCHLLQRNPPSKEKKKERLFHRLDP